MGKSRRNKGKPGQRSDPIAKPIKPPSDPELAALREKSILPILKDLQSAEPKSRRAAATAVANIIQNTKCRKLLLREQIVHVILTQTLTDASLESRASGWEILKLLTQEEDPDFCVHLIRLDILTAIEFAADKVAESMRGPNPEFAKASKIEQSLAWSVAESLTTITSAVAEAQDDTVLAVANNEKIVNFLFTLISSNLPTEAVINSTLSCLLTLTEDNRVLVERLLGDRDRNVFKHLMSFKAERSLRAVLACGVLHNIFSVMQWDDSNPGRDKSSDAVLVPTLVGALEASSSGVSKNGYSTSSPSDVLQLALEVFASIGTALQATLERNNKAGDEWKGIADDDTAMDADEDDALHAEEGGPDDEMKDEEIEADMEMVTAADDDIDEATGLRDLPTLSLLIQKAIPSIVRTCNTVGQKGEIAQLIRSHAFTALSNIAWTVSCLDFSEQGNASILAAWAPAALEMWTEAITPVLSSDTSDVSLAAVVTSLAWAIARTIHDRIPLSADEPKKFMALYQASTGLPAETEDPFQALGVKCIGVLGQFALDPAPIQLNREIGVFLISIVNKLPETPTADAIEALNQLFDIYGDEKSACDSEVFWKDNFLQQFEGMTPKLKAMAKKIDKRKSTELRARADETILNLSRFIQYKQKHKPQEVAMR